MRNKILIISSEILTPEYTLGSTFELSQAKVLSSDFDVAIISVSVHTPFFQACRSAIKNLFLMRWRTSGTFFATVCTLLYRILRGQKFWAENIVIEGIDVFIGHGFTFRNLDPGESPYGVWLRSGESAFDRYLSTCGEPTVIHAHGRFMLAGLLAIELRRKYRLPYVYTEHSSRFPSGYVPSDAIPLLNQIIDGCFRYIAVSQHLLHKVEETLDREIPKAKVIFNVLDPAFQVPLSRKVGRTGFQFMNIASLEHRKGIDILLRAFKRAFLGHPAFKLIIVGEGPLLNDLIELTSYLELNHVVEFAGVRTKFSLVTMLDSTHVFVFPSRFETFGVSVIEAMSRGCPVIVTSCGGPEEYVLPEAGMVIESENELALVRALKEITEHYDRYNPREIHEYALKRFGSSAFLDGIREIYSDAALVSKASQNS